MATNVPKPHHTRQELCTTRPKYREGRQLKAVKVYTINLESRYLLVQNVPALGAMQELIKLFAQYGEIQEYRALDTYPAPDFTETYLFRFKATQSARVAKSKLDDHNFFGGSLHICYAPEYETVEDTRVKLQERRMAIAKRIRKLDAEKKMMDEKQTKILKVDDTDKEEAMEGETVPKNVPTCTSQGSQDNLGDSSNPAPAPALIPDVTLPPPPVLSLPPPRPSPYTRVPPPHGFHQPPPPPHFDGQGSAWQYPPPRIGGGHHHAPPYVSNGPLPPPESHTRFGQIPPWPPRPPRSHHMPYQDPRVVYGDGSGKWNNSHGPHNHHRVHGIEEDYYGTKAHTVNSSDTEPQTAKSIRDMDESKKSTSDLIIKDYKLKSVSKFVPRQIKKSGNAAKLKEKLHEGVILLAGSTSVNSIGEKPVASRTVVDPVNEEVRKNATILSKRAGPQLPEKEEERRAQFKISETGDESLDVSTAEIRKRVQQFSTVVPPPQLKRRKKTKPS